MADLAEIREKLGGRRILASVSGGKDSAAMCLHLRELGLEYEAIFLDTGWEHELTYEYLRGELVEKIGPIRWLAGERGFEALAEHKGMMPSRTIRFCTQELKVYPMQRYIRTIADAGDDLVDAVGIRAAESPARARLAEWEWSDGFDCEVWRPLLRWTEEEVIAIHHRHGLRPNPLYLLGAKRVGCWPCIFSAKEEIRQVAELDPGRIDRIRALEERVVAAARARAEGRGEVFERPGAFFQLRIPGGKRTNTFVPIDEVVRWAKTSRGGRQFEMFAPSAPDAGCMRWGLCDTTEGE